MQKVWHWIREKKGNSFRKWQSANIFNSRRDSTDTRDGTASLRSAHDLCGKKGLKPIGGSEDALATRVRESAKKRKHHKSVRKVGVGDPTLFDQPSDEHAFDNFFDEVKPALEAIHKEKVDSNFWYLSEQRRGSIRSQHVITDFIDGEYPSSNVMSLSAASAQDFFDHSEAEPQASTSAEEPSPQTETTTLPDDSDEEDHLEHHGHMDEHQKDEDTPPPEKSEKVLRFNIPEVSVSFVDDNRRSRPPSPLLNGRCRAVSEPHSDPTMNPKGEEHNGESIPASPHSENGSVFEDALAGSPPKEDLGTPITTVVYHSALEPVCPSTPRSRDSAEKRRQSMAIHRRQSGNQGNSPSVNRRPSNKIVKSTIIPLTGAQIHLVRTLWRQIYMSKGPTVIGSTIFHKFFFKCPKVKEQFRRCPLPRNFPNHDSFAKAHCKAMSELFDQVIENLENLDTMTSELERVGRIHAEVMHGELSTKIWNDIAETFIDCTLEWGDRRCRTETVRKAWALIIAFMIEKIKLGHSDQRKRMLSMRATAANIDQLAVASLQIA